MNTTDELFLQILDKLRLSHKRLNFLLSKKTDLDDNDEIFELQTTIIELSSKL